MRQLQRATSRQSAGKLLPANNDVSLLDAGKRFPLDFIVNRRFRQLSRCEEELVTTLRWLLAELTTFAHRVILGRLCQA